MPYDPNFPPDNQPLNAAPFRDQNNALKALNDAQQTKWDTLAAQLANITPLNMTVSDPPTVNEVQSLVYQMDAILAAMQSV